MDNNKHRTKVPEAKVKAVKEAINKAGGQVLDVEVNAKGVKVE